MGNCVGHEPCPKCGSKDNLARYDDGSAHCFSQGCSYFEKEDGEKKERKRVTTPKGLNYSGEFRPLTERSIDEETAKFFKVKKHDKGHIFYPLFDTDGNMVATKIRYPDEKKFVWTGDKSKATLFGMNLFAPGCSKYLTVVEGQDDVLAAYKMLGSKYPVISINSAASAVKDIKDNIDYIESFDYVVFMLDNDEAGRGAAQSAAELLSPGKAKIVTLARYKDANDYLKARKAKDFNSEFWNAKAYSSIGVVTLADAWEEYEQRLNTKIIEIPDYFGKAKHMLNGGFAVSEITTITADTSVGKTTQLINLFKGILELDKSRNITALMLETTLGELVHLANKMEHGVDIDVGTSYNSKEFATAKELFSKIEWTQRLHVINHTGSFSTTEEIIKKVRNTAVATGSDLILIDPLQQATPNIDHETIRSFMDSLLKVAQQIPAAVVVTSHIKNRQRKDAYDITEDDAIGSSAIKQVTWTQILLARDKMAADDNIKNSTQMQIPKCRRTGRTGQAGWIKYNQDKGILEEAEDPFAMFGEEFE